MINQNIRVRRDLRDHLEQPFCLMNEDNEAEKSEVLDAAS